MNLRVRILLTMIAVGVGVFLWGMFAGIQFSETTNRRTITQQVTLKPQFDKAIAGWGACSAQLNQAAITLSTCSTSLDMDNQQIKKDIEAMNTCNSSLDQANHQLERDIQAMKAYRHMLQP